MIIVIVIVIRNNNNISSSIIITDMCDGRPKLRNFSLRLLSQNENTIRSNGLPVTDPIVKQHL